MHATVHRNFTKQVKNILWFVEGAWYLNLLVLGEDTSIKEHMLRFKEKYFLALSFMDDYLFKSLKIQQKFKNMIFL